MGWFLFEENRVGRKEIEEGKYGNGACSVAFLRCVRRKTKPGLGCLVVLGQEEVGPRRRKRKKRKRGGGWAGRWGDGPAQLDRSNLFFFFSFYFLFLLITFDF